MKRMKRAEYLTKTINLLLIASLCLACQPFAGAQTRPVYKAELLVADGKKIKSEQIELSLEGDNIKIQSRKKPAVINNSIPFSAIESVDYTYSDRPRYTAGVLTALAFGIAAFPIFFTKTKKNWLTVNAGKDSAIMQLESSNYRMLLLEMRRRGIKISDLGDRDDKNERREKDIQTKKENL